ncbi:MAG: TraR/DksA family transcriptional regulator [Planctomycetota bacterium]|nr:MAG: TraR/DksA family transcriptional regulator [Planctomycetota bacterium]
MRASRAAAAAAIAGVADKPEGPPPKRKTKGPYSATQLRPLRKDLQGRRARILADLNMMGDEALRAADPDVDSDSMADHSSDAYERNLTLGLMEAEARTLRQIDTALAAMDAKLYGLCTECDDAIPLRRLEALPFATTCVPCQQRAERGF